jgi:hypothetical protein
MSASLQRGGRGKPPAGLGRSLAYRSGTRRSLEPQGFASEGMLRNDTQPFPPQTPVTKVTGEGSELPVQSAGNDELETWNRNRWREAGNRSQASKGAGWMPWLREAMKDVVSCDKLRGGANNL